MNKNKLKNSLSKGGSLIVLTSAIGLCSIAYSTAAFATCTAGSNTSVPAGSWNYFDGAASETGMPLGGADRYFYCDGTKWALEGEFMTEIYDTFRRANLLILSACAAGDTVLATDSAPHQSQLCLRHTDSSTGGGGKIACTAMNKAYGFGGFRQAIWLAQSKGLRREYQLGYHYMATPFLAYAYAGNSWTHKATRAFVEHIARRRTLDIWKQRKGKRDFVGMIERAVTEPICLAAGVVIAKFGNEKKLDKRTKKLFSYVKPLNQPKVNYKGQPSDRLMFAFQA